MLPLIHSEEGEAMDRGRPLKPLEVSGSTREELESLSRSLSLAAGLVSRAKIVLLCADGFDNKAVAEEVGTSRQTVGKWRERFRTQGLMGLYDERRPGKPRSIEDDEVMVLLRKTLDTEPADGSTHWSCRSMADTTGVSKSTVHRVPFPTQLEPVTYPGHFETRFVSTNGGIRWYGDRVPVSRLLAGHNVGLEEIDHGLFEVYFGPIWLGRFGTCQRQWDTLRD